MSMRFPQPGSGGEFASSGGAKTAGKIGAVSVLVLVLLTVLIGSYFTVPSGHVAVITRFGAVKPAIYEEGLHFKMPFVDDRNLVNIQVLSYEAKAVDASTRDLQSVSATFVVQYAVDRTDAPEVYRNYRTVDVLQARALQPAIEESFKAVSAQQTAEELVTQRAAVREKILVSLREKLQPHFVTIKDMSVTNFAFSQAFTEAIEQKVTAEQRALKAKNDLERIKIEGEQRVAQAKAEADAIRVQAEAIQKQGGQEYVQLKAIEKWNGQLPTVAGGAVPFINLNTAEHAKK